MKPEIDAAVMRVIEGAQFVLGPEVTAFEERFASYCGVKHCLAVSSGTSALHLALLAAGIGPGDEVITVSMTFVATTAAVLYSSAKPVYVDVDPLKEFVEHTNSLVMIRHGITTLGRNVSEAYHRMTTLTSEVRRNIQIEIWERGAGYTLTAVPDAHLCCGSAGTYSLLEPQLSKRLLRDKVRALESGKPRMIVSANIGCLAHIESGTRLPVRHWIELLEESLA